MVMATMKTSGTTILTVKWTNLYIKHFQHRVQVKMENNKFSLSLLKKLDDDINKLKSKSI